jgi:fructokinase
VILVAGNSVVDLLHKGVPGQMDAVDSWSKGNVHFADRPPEAVLGGNGASVAFVLGHLGNEVVLNSRIGEDVFGNLIQNWLRDAGVHLLHAPGDDTSVNTILLDDNGARRSIYYSGQKVEWELSLQAESANWFYASGYGQVDRTDLACLESVFRAFQSRGVSVMFDPGPWFEGCVEKSEMIRTWALVDCLAGTKHELEAFCSERNPLALTEELLSLGPDRIVIKQGGDGVTIGEQRTPPVTLETSKVNAENTVGAGDVFNAGILHRLNQKSSLAEAAGTAMDLAARAVKSGRGALGAIASLPGGKGPVYQT